MDLNEIVETRLYPDMLPFRFQVIQVASLSLGAINGVQTGKYSPPPAPEDLDYQALQDLTWPKHDPVCSHSPPKL